MSNLIIKSGAITLEKCIRNKNALHEIINMLPGGLDVNESLFTINGEKINPIEFNLDRVIDGNLIINIPPKGVDPWTIAIALVVSLVASVALAPDIPNTTTSGAKESPNNGFSGQTNQIRLDEQEPNLYGENISYPDSVVASGGAWSYVDNQKIVEEVFLIGIGDYEYEPPKYELTPLSDITGSSYEVFTPNVIVPRVWGQFNSEFIDGQALPGANSDDVEIGREASTSNSGVPLIEVDGYLIASDITPDPDWDYLFSVSESSVIPVNLSYTYYRLVDNFPPAPPGCFPATATASGLMSMSLEGGGKYKASISGIDISLPNCDPGDPVYGSNLSVTELLGATLSVTVPIVTNELQVSFDFRGGLRGTAGVRVDITGNGASQVTEFYEYSANTSKQQFFSEVIPISHTGNVVVKLNRTNNEKTDGSDRIQVSQVASNSYRYNVDYGNRTMLQTKRKATEQAIKYKESKVNIKATRKTISYDTNTGLINEELTASRSFADAILHEYVKVNGFNYIDLPLEDMYEISDRIGVLGNFDSTFSDKEQSLGDKLKIIANVARCEITNTSDKWVIYRNEPQQFTEAQFDSRNIAADSPEEVSYRGFQDASNDGVKLKWKNPEINKFEYIYYKMSNGSSVKCEHQGGGVYLPELPRFPLEVDLVGCYTESQANDRADLECRSLIFIQKTLSTKTLRDGDNVSRGQRVRHADYYMDDNASGEIEESNGNIHKSFSEIILPDDTSDHYVSYTNEYGESLNPIPCTIIDDYHFMASLPEAYHSNGFTIQCGSRFIISTLENQINSLYRVNDKIQNQDGTINLELVEYDERIYPELD